MSALAMPATTTPIPLVDLNRSHAAIADELRGAFDRVLRTSSFVGGAEVEAFEAQLATYVGTRHAVGVSSGTSALELTLRSAGIGHGDEVILPPNTFFATVEAVVAAGATPVLADVDAGTALLDPAAVEGALTSRTAAVIVVHLYGQPVDGIRFRKLADAAGVMLIEDAAQAIGARWEDMRVGSIGHAAAFSFYPTKNLGALGDGGAIVTDDTALAYTAGLLRSHAEVPKGTHLLMGGCQRLDGLQAAFLAVKLRHLDQVQRDRDRIVRRYRDALSSVPDARLIVEEPRARHVHHLLVCTTTSRDHVREVLRCSGVEAGVHYPVPIHLQRPCRGLGARGQFPAAEHLCRTVLSLPLFPGMRDDEVHRSVDALADALGRSA